MDYTGMYDALLESKLPFVIIAYLTSIPVSRAIFGYGSLYEKNKSLCKKIMFSYNVMMTIYSGVTCYLTWTTLAKYDFSIQSETCDGLFQDPLLAKLNEYFFYSKFLEFADSWFLTLRNAPVSVLQWYHHAGVVIVTWQGPHFNSEPTMLAMGLNTFIHTLMYTYYGLAVYKFKVPLVAKATLTLFQLIQFGLSIYFTSDYFDQDCFNSIPLRPEFHVYSIAYVWGLVVLFGNFFFQSYLLPKKQKKKSA